jgi:hypothetical protein
MTLSPVLLQEQLTVVLLLERALVSWSLLMNVMDMKIYVVRATRA